MKLANKLDRVTAIVMFVFFTVLLFLSWPLGYWDEFAPSSGFAPIWVAVFGMVLAALLLFERVPDTLVTEAFDRAGLSRVLQAGGGILAFVLLTPFVGMILAGFLLMLGLLLIVLRRPLLASLFTSLISITLVYGIFVAWLNVALPKGFLGF